MSPTTTSFIRGLSSKGKGKGKGVLEDTIEAYDVIVLKWDFQFRQDSGFNFHENAAELD